MVRAKVMVVIKERAELNRIDPSGNLSEQAARFLSRADCAEFALVVGAYILDQQIAARQRRPWLHIDGSSRPQDALAREGPQDCAHSQALEKKPAID
ncbi:MAG: hypothetical protein WA231_11745 [Methylocella sp.]